jgi:hypothetical protein
VLDRGRIDLVTPEGFAAVLPEIAIPSLPFIGGYGLTVASLDRVEATLRSGGLASRRAGDALVAPFPEELGKGAWLFSEDSTSAIVFDVS